MRIAAHARRHASVCSVGMGLDVRVFRGQGRIVSKNYCGKAACIWAMATPSIRGRRGGRKREADVWEEQNQHKP